MLRGAPHEQLPVGFHHCYMNMLFEAGGAVTFQVCTLLVGGYQCMNGQITAQQLTAFVMVRTAAAGLMATCQISGCSKQKWCSMAVYRYLLD